jgi:hypothetical protein
MRGRRPSWCGCCRKHSSIGLTPIPEQFDMEGTLIKEGSYKNMLDAFGIA